MQVQVIISGKTYNAEIEQKQVDAIIKQSKKTGYERVETGDKYNCSYGYSSISNSYIEKHDASDNKFFDNADYYNNEQLAADNIRADTLMRKLRRFAVEENAKVGKEIDWETEYQCKYYIYYNYRSNNFETEYSMYIRHLGLVYFSKKEIAQKAINTFNSELKWYFTEYQDHLKEVQ